MKHECGCVTTVDPETGVTKSTLKCMGHQPSMRIPDYSYYEELHAIQHRMPRNRHYMDELVEAWEDINFSLPPGQDKTCLEIGCGTAPYTPLILRAGYDYEAVENSGFAAEWVRHNFGVPVEVKPFESWKATKQYRLIFAIHVLEHFIDSPAMLKKIFGMLEPGGLLVFVVPDNSDLVNPDHYWFYTVETMRKTLLDRGFQNIKMTTKKRVAHENFIYGVAHKPEV